MLLQLFPNSDRGLLPIRSSISSCCQDSGPIALRCSSASLREPDVQGSIESVGQQSISFRIPGHDPYPIVLLPLWAIHPGQVGPCRKCRRKRIINRYQKQSIGILECVKVHLSIV